MTPTEVAARQAPNGQVEASADPISVVHELNSALSVQARGVELFRYIYRHDIAASECPAPYFHPLRTFADEVVTGNRPHDHRWHKGLAMTASHLSEQNFWGGGTYTPGAPGAGYLDLPNVGALHHREFAEISAGERTGFVEHVDWITAAGEKWIEERRTVGVSYVRGDQGGWLLDFGTELSNVRGAALDFGSPTVFGRELAGYCGFFWRGPRSFTGGAVISPGGGSAAEMMGTAAPWLAFVGKHDNTNNVSTLLFQDAPDNAIPDGRWFVRSEPYPVVNPSLAFFDPLVLADGDTLRLRYRLFVFDGARDREQLDGVIEGNPW
ncbi:PmoA family protein [Saccharopolyspora sp. 5N708]|uniref:PmoA family protein n=1 Tax=Saccharopolyspora sp. 5N708 TaxID=3457424 RepID=UPI003FD674DC